MREGVREARNGGIAHSAPTSNAADLVRCRKRLLGSLFDSSTASVHLHPGPTLRRPVALSPCRPVALLPCRCFAAAVVLRFTQRNPSMCCLQQPAVMYKYMYSYTLPL